MNEINWIENMKKIHLAPGDVLVVSVKSLIREEVYARIMDELKAIFPDHKAIILGPDVELGVIGRLVIPGQLSAEERKQIRATWEAAQDGFSTNHLAILDGEVRFEQPGQETPAEENIDEQTN